MLFANPVDPRSVACRRAGQVQQKVGSEATGRNQARCQLEHIFFQAAQVLDDAVAEEEVKEPGGKLAERLEIIKHLDLRRSPSIPPPRS